MIRLAIVSLVLGLAPAVLAAGPASASASGGVTPLLTGGVVHWAGQADRDEQATNSAAATIDNTTDVGEADSPIAWNTHTLVDFHYPDAPKTDFAAGAPISAWDETPTTVIGVGPQHYEEHFVSCDANDGNTCVSTETKDFACNWTEVGETFVVPASERDMYLALQGAFQNLSCSGMTAWDQQSLDNPWTSNIQTMGYQLKLPAQPMTTDTLGPIHLTHGATLNDCQMVAECDSDTQAGASDVTVSCALCVTAIDLEQRDVTTGKWTPIARDQETYDGNAVRLLVTVHNATNTAIQAPVRFRDLTVKRDLVLAKNGEHPATQPSFPADADTHLMFDWDTSGFAWDKGATSAPHQIAVLTPYGGARVDQQVAPRPIVLVHGLNSSAATWAAYLGHSGFVAGRRPDWIARAVQMNTAIDFGSTVHANSGRLAEFVEQLRDETGAEHIDLVAHSMGGLISRDYLNTREPSSPDGRPVITRLVELGTPNTGTPCATVGAAVAGTLLTPGTLLGLTTIIQLTPQYLSGFNRAMPGFNGTKVSVEAGDIGTRKLCNPSSENDDEIVPVSSAWWTIPDHGVMAGLKHTEMTGSRTAWTAWVGPHLAVDTDGHPQFGQTAPLAAPSAAARRLAAATPPSRLAAATAVTLGAKRSTTVRVKVPRGDTALAIQLVAGSAVNASLINPAGHVVATQRGPSAEGSLGLRGLQVSKPTAGSWTLRLTNTGSRALPTVAEAWLVRDALTASAHAAQKAKRGPLTVTVQLRRSGRAYLGQPVTAKLRFESGGRATSVRLHDDGRGGDARARDGIYSARVSRPASGLVDLVTTATTKAGNAYSVLRYTAS